MATAVCDPLWGSTPIITLTASSSVAFDEAAVGTPDYGSLCGRTSFEPHPGEIPASQQLVRKPDGKADGRHIESRPARTPDATDQPRRRCGPRVGSFAEVNDTRRAGGRCSAPGGGQISVARL